jgi:membrane protein implicated in regulation of membrane protease activity
MASWPLALLLAGVFLAAELLTRTFYFLAVALALALLALVDVLFHPGEILSAVVFVFLAALLLGGAHLLRKRMRNESSQLTTAIDTGRIVTVVGHQEDRLRVRYRGTLWTARLAQAGDPPPVGARLTIVGREGNTLLLGAAVENASPETPSPP